MFSRKKHETRDNRSTSNTQILLERRVEESVNQFEKDLKDLYKQKIKYQKSVLTEELRILLHVERMARIEELQKEETVIKYKNIFLCFNFDEKNMVLF